MTDDHGSFPAPAPARAPAPVIDSYLDETRAPVYSLILVAPFVLIYHIGVLALPHVDPDFIGLNYADQLIRHFLLEVLGAATSLVGVVVLAGACAVWQFKSERGLRFRVSAVGLSLAECLAWSVILYEIFWRLFQAIFNTLAALPLAAVPSETTPETTSAVVSPAVRLARELVLDCGAGVYEEFLFRVILVFGLAWVGTELLGLTRTWAGCAAIALAAVLFSFAHHVTPHGDPIRAAAGGFHPQFWSVFLFRTILGLYFGALCYFRSFGVAVATHALYDILVSVNRTWEGG